jgi:formylglycine-generating enzyme required for sulfatase activity
MPGSRKIAVSNTGEGQQPEQPALEIQLFASALQLLAPLEHLLSNFRRDQRDSVAPCSKSVRRAARLRRDACVVPRWLTHAALSNLSGRAAQPIEKPSTLALPTGRPKGARGAVALLALACSTETAPSATRAEVSPSSLAAAPSVAAAPASPRAAPDARVSVPEGSFRAGTEPGRHERRPELEPRLGRVALGPFAIDAWPYPDGASAPQLGLPRARARELCEARQGRLCTELEWERACKGPDSQAFAGSAEFDASCALAAGGCRSGFGVHALGSLSEWTASDGEAGALAARRGAGPSDPAAQHRCAHRTLSSPLEGDEQVGFRCCYGAPNAARISVPGLGTTFQKLELPLAELARWLQGSPITASLAQNLSYFPEGSAEAVVARGPGDRQGFLFSTAPLVWNPVRGAEFLVVTARSGPATSFVVVFHALGDGAYALASSFIMQDEPGPIALGFNGYIRPRLHFSSCWGCPGETGKILYRDPDSVVIVQP